MSAMPNPNRGMRGNADDAAKAAFMDEVEAVREVDICVCGHRQTEHAPGVAGGVKCFCGCTEFEWAKPISQRQPMEPPAETTQFVQLALPKYVYVASSWRNPLHVGVCAALRSAGIPHYDFKNPEGGTGFSWKEVKTDVPSASGVDAKGSDWEPVDEYMRMIAHPRAEEGFTADYDAMKRADVFIMVLPCGKSAHLELGWAVGAGKRTAILLEDPVEPELMYKMVDYMTPSLFDLLGWLGVPD